MTLVSPLIDRQGQRISAEHLARFKEILERF